ncbi:hypothetical protein [Streptomyces yaizuensis]|uniref:Integral membrane protein n=1 Tax=Streptomyces yaizuensis TaxID=2989713 RepID=A0ABQ5P696_9ACTN|nr:hypothetical protein [Streptomyces sp. YSPA8]GLF97988.1 hypothetical protein SYYSPA8_26845 [Streptomyces sp. YSPA8]
MSDNARKYCGSYVEGRLDFGGSGFFELPVAMVGGVLVSVAAFGAGMLLTRGVRSRRGRVIFSATAAALLLGAAMWGHFAWQGTPAGVVSDSGRCSQENIPEWWPAWLPA